MKKLRLFEFCLANGSKVWICAFNPFEAIKLYIRYTEDYILETYQDGDDLVEIPEESWSKYELVGEEPAPYPSKDKIEIQVLNKTFLQVIEEQAGKPGIIATNDP